MQPHGKRLFSWRRYRLALLSLTYAVLVIASARPVLIGDQIHLPRMVLHLVL